ncbi:hypothetical protein GP475_02275 [Corynebacterium poyangense]|uniref:Uncharacterized protein n=1 Tax=Corynebacterium poyangense TaxID=2684405 RepID=A0A7H0SM14_9CORY|nr:hypothetical protein [Corynebacterium poyangense]MBZ8177700.1 hypothetical protein [Corynebacterium poyangense]QNQ89589.1 hypothetical protein GP475_02275 [Corynebacterium poyangense]
MAQHDQLDVDVAEKLAADITAIDGVADMHAGNFGEVALYYPRTRVRGLRQTTGDNPRFEVHIVADLSRPLDLYDVAERVRQVASAAQSLPVDVTIADATA